MLELWQTEWCPASHRIRQRLTELEIDYVIRQVPVEKDERHALRRTTGSTIIPALVAGDEVIVGESEIRAWLDDQIADGAHAEVHRLKADKARRRYLEEECECLQLATH